MYDVPLPKRFRARTNPDEQYVLVEDLETKRHTRIDLGLYGPVCKTLDDLFGTGKHADEPPPVPAAVADAATAKSTPSQKRPSSSPKAAQKAAEAPRGRRKPAAQKRAVETPPATSAPSSPRPSDLEPRIERAKYTMELQQFPGSDLWGYKITAGKKTLGWIQRKNDRAFVLCDPDQQRFQESTHRNLIGAEARFSAAVLPNL